MVGNMSTKKLKNDYRGEHTERTESTVGTGKHQRVVRGRKPKEGAPSLKEYALDHPDGNAWRDRKRGKE